MKPSITKVTLFLQTRHSQAAIGAEAKRALDELGRLREYTNGVLFELSDRFANVCKAISSVWG